MEVTKDMTFFNPSRDLKPVEPFGFVDLQNAMVNGVIESQVAEAEENYNGIENPAVIVGKPRDVFDAIMAKTALKDSATAAAAAVGSDEKKD